MHACVLQPGAILCRAPCIFPVVCCMFPADLRACFGTSLVEGGGREEAVVKERVMMGIRSPTKRSKLRRWRVENVV